MSATPAAIPSSKFVFKNARDLMRAIGSSSFDPVPPSQIVSFMDKREPQASRAWAWLTSKTMHPGRGGKRSAYARDGRGALTVNHAAADLKMTNSNAWRAFRELQDRGRCHLDEKGVVWYRGDVPEPQLPTGEEEANGEDERISTDLIPRPFRQFIQSLEKNDADKATRDVIASSERWARRKADAMAYLRACEEAEHQELLKPYGWQETERRGRPRVDPQTLTVKVTLKETVQIEEPGFVQNQAEPFVQKDFERVQIPVSLLPSESGLESFRVSGEPAAAEMIATPPKTAPKEVESPELDEPSDQLRDASPVVEYVQRHFGRKLAANDPLRSQFAKLPAEWKLPAAAVTRFLAEKVDRKESARYSIDTPGALYKFAQEDLPAWIRRSGRAIESDAKWEAAEQRRREEAERFEPERFNAELKSLAAKKGFA